MSSSDVASSPEGPLSQEQLVSLKQEGYLLGNPSGGKRKVSALLLTPSDHSSFGSVSSTSSSSSRSSTSLRLKGYVSSPAGEDFDLPTNQESVAALEYMGFNHAEAEDIYLRWSTREANYPYDFLGHAIGPFDSKGPNPNKESAEAFMTRYGLQKEFQDAILDPEFADVFGTELLTTWIVDTLSSRHHTIGFLLRRCQNLALRGGGKGHKKKKSRTSLPTDLFEKGKGVAGSAEASGSSNEPNETTFSNVSSVTEDLALPEDNVRIGPPAEPLPDHLILYKGLATMRVTDASRPFMRKDGTIDLTCLNSGPGGDFNWKTAASYWAAEEQTAEVYRRFAVRRDLRAETWIIRIQVPRSFITDHRKESVWFSSEWKEYVWLCRTERPVPDKFAHFAASQIMEGHTCDKVTATIKRIVDVQQVEEGMTREFCMVVRGPKGQKITTTQWVFAGTDTTLMEELAKAVRGKMHIDVHAPGSVTSKK